MSDNRTALKKVVIRAPQTEKEWQDYYNLRWQVLRAPWGEPEGSEKDAIEDSTVHRAAFVENELAGVARLQLNSKEEAQIRYMAVKESLRSLGLGRRLVQALENEAMKLGALKLKLDARENAVDFYRAIGYEIVADSYLLFGEIKHFLMQKMLLGGNL